jgi:hypothetical protein
MFPSIYSLRASLWLLRKPLGLGTCGCWGLLATSNNRSEEIYMKAILLPAAFAVAVTGLTLSSTPVPARGCLKGAVIGGVAGHFAGHHGLLGAGAGCIIGHHEANKHARERERAYHEGYGSSAAPYDHGDGYGQR